MYQISQAKMVEGLTMLIEDRLRIISILISGIVIILLGSYIYWLTQIRKKKY